MLIPFSVRRDAVVNIRETDPPVLTWHHLIRLTMEEMGGRAKLSELGDLLAQHPKAQRNPHFRDRILGEVLHKDKSAVSRARSEYEGKVRERLFRQFLEEQEN